MRSARRLILFYIYVKLGENISDGIRVMERTQMMQTLTDGRTDIQNFGRYNIIPSPLFVAGNKKTKQTLFS